MAESTWQDELTTRLRTLLRTAPLHRLEDNKTMRSEALDAHDLRALSLRAIDAIIEAMGMREGGSLSEVRAALAPLIRSAERIPIGAMATFSRGQQLTAAIMLYCTLVQLRSRSRGRSGRDTGVLILDNPVGTCSSVPLLDLQLHIARAMGVQLVYTTGVHDHDALATFPNTVRLRNAHRDRLTGDHHVTVEGVVEGTRIALREVR